MIVVIKAKIRRNLRNTVKCEGNYGDDRSNHRDVTHPLAPLRVHANQGFGIPASVG